jgi:hypothetical protein
MANKGYKVLVDELTVHKAVRPLTHPITGESMGWQQGAGETWFLDEVVPAEAMNPEWAEALESGDEDNPLYADLSKVLEASSDEPALNEAYRMGLPFEGYDDMDEDDILAAMRVLPSAAVMRMKDWEVANEGREAIVNFNIGYGESPDDRQAGRIGQLEDEEVDETKPVRAIRTRQAEEGEPVIPGEGITGTGDPPVIPGTAAKAEEEEGSSGGTKRSTRAGRRPRPSSKKAADKSDKSEGGEVRITGNKPDSSSS